MIWLIIAAVVFSAVLLWMLIETRGTYHLLWVIPICIGLITSTYNWAFSMFGYPTDEYQAGQRFVLISYFTPQEEDELIVWVVLEDEQEPKAIRIPYDPKEEKNLQEIAEKMSGGQRFIGEFSGSAEASQGLSNGEDGDNDKGSRKSAGGILTFEELSVEHFLPAKGYIEEEQRMEVLQ